MTDAARLLVALQHADSFFPGGAAAFSWGLETLLADSCIASAADLKAFVAGQLVHRWARCDRPALAAAHAAAGDLDRVAAVDRAVDLLALARELREGSRRAGGALLASHAALGTAGAEAYRNRLRARLVQAHLPVVQGLVWQAAGLAEPEAAAMAAHAHCVGLLAAALRLGALGHLEAQRILGALRPEIARILAVAPPPLERIGGFAPAAEIAAMRHEAGVVRLFAN